METSMTNESKPVSLCNLRCRVNGKAVTAQVDHRLTLGDFLRHELGLTGTHHGCEHGVCGACTVLVDGLAQRACLQLAVQAENRVITTVEGLTPSGSALGILQQCFKERRALQCGYCTPGFLMTLEQFLRDCPDPTEDALRDALSGNICRCTGYQPIVEAALLAAARMRGASDPDFGDVISSPAAAPNSDPKVETTTAVESDYAF
jgi:aerobic carbon-monoxide dehydrogenase large subunit